VEGPQEIAPRSAPLPRGSLDRALALVEFLRANCPWDAAQTPETLLRHLVEETYEGVDAIVRKDDAALRDELGDLLLNLAFQVVLAEERGAFDREDVVTGLEGKMRRRHPHLYGEGERTEWEALKARERAGRSGPRGGPGEGTLSELPAGLDPLVRAHRMQSLVARVGFDWSNARGAWEKVREEVEEVGHELEGGGARELEDEIGDLLFAVVNLARRAGVFAPAALARSNAKFTRRFEAIELLARERGIAMADAGLAALDELWDEVKRREREGAAAPRSPG
jgi:nucleoside triphosphate diphosphatase